MINTRCDSATEQPLAQPGGFGGWPPATAGGHGYAGPWASAGRADQLGELRHALVVLGSSAIAASWQLPPDPSGTGDNGALQDCLDRAAYVLRAARVLSLRPDTAESA